MQTIRIIFRKTGFLRYISHLDLQRAMQRAMARAEIPLWHTQGFNPHSYLCFASPLSLGINSVTEILDIKPNPEKRMPTNEIKTRLNAALTEDLAVSDVYEADTSLNDIRYAEYSFKIEKHNNNDSDFRKMLNQNFIPVIKKTKRREEEINLKDEIAKLNLEGDNIKITLPAGNTKTIKPLLLITSFRDLTGKNPEYDITREKFFTKDFNIFR